MGRLLKVLGLVSDLGIRGSDSPVAQKQVRIFNQFLLFIIPISLGYAVLFGLLHFWGVFALAIWATIYTCAVLFLNSRRYFSYAKILFVLNSNFCISVATLLLGPRSGIYYLFFILFFLPFYLFNVQEPCCFKVSFFSNFVTFFALWFYFGSFSFYMPFHWSYPSLVFYLSALVVCALLIFLSFSYRRYEFNLYRLLIETTSSLKSDHADAQSSLNHQESLSKLSLAIAHEIKNPVSAILATCELTQSDSLGDRRRFIEVLKKNISRLLTVTNSMLSFGAVSYDVPEQIDINAVIEEIVYLVQSMAKSQKVHIQTQFQDLPLLNLDNIRLYQIIMNLVVNAIEAMPDGGQLIINTERFSSVDLSESIRISVRDTGSGISMEDQARIFESYMTKKMNNTGLGLFVVKQNVDYLGGDVAVSSILGDGATFIVTLPVGKDNQDA